MVTELLQKYIWLVQTFIRAGEKGLSLEEISAKWEDRFDSAYSRRTFNNHREAVEDVFGIRIDCNRSTNRYFVEYSEDVSDEDADRYIKIFTLLGKEEIEAAIAEHQLDPGQRKLQKLLAKEVTILVHGEAEYENALAASRMLFGNSTSEELRKLDERTFLAVFSGVPTFDVKKEDLPCGIIDLLSVKTQVFPSKGECRKMIQGGGVSVNKDKIASIDHEITENDIVDGKYILVQRGKKNYFIINVL